ncbi:hypothetical protein DPMN_172650, partial [Dreissena polymorpha]
MIPNRIVVWCCSYDAYDAHDSLAYRKDKTLAIHDVWKTLINRERGRVSSSPLQCSLNTPTSTMAIPTI